MEVIKEGQEFLGRSEARGKVRQQGIWEGQALLGKSGGRKYGKARSPGESQAAGNMGRAEVLEKARAGEI